MFVWVPCHVMCIAVLIGRDPATRPLPPPPFALGLEYEGAILGSSELTVRQFLSNFQ
jgi:hypothetical protein